MHRFFHRHIDFCRCSPKHHDAGTALLRLEAADIFAQGLHHLPTGLTWLYIIAVQAFGIVLVKGRRHRYNLFQLGAHGFYVFLLQHFSVHCSLVSVLGIDIPAAENDIVQLCQRDNLVVFQVSFVLALANTYFIVLCHGTDGLGETLSGHKNASHESSGDSAITNDENAQFSFCGLDNRWGHIRLFSDVL